MIVVALRREDIMITTLSEFAHRFGVRIRVVNFLVFLAAGLGLIVWGIRYAISQIKEMSPRHGWSECFSSFHA